MTRLSWGTPGERFYEAGVDRGVAYVDNVGYAWNGLLSVQEKSSGGTPDPYYFDGFKYIQIASAEEFEATLSAISSPREFGLCDGSYELASGLIITQQRRKQFGLSYRTRIGNDVDGTDHGYKIHLVYNALAAPSERTNSTTSSSGQDPVSMSWDITTNPPALSGSRPTAHFIVDSTRTDPTVLANLEDILYGLDTVPPTMPTPAELVALFA